ncbi:MAG TPA: magnesium transporter CorA family protein [Devosiaceae bacterium]|jgi:magnesium transporter
MLRFFSHDGERLVLSLYEPTDNATHTTNAVWYDLLNPTPEEDRFVEGCLGISIPTREEMADIEPSARLYNEGGTEFMTMTALVRIDTDEPAKTPVTFVLRNNQLVTVRYADPRPFSLFEARARKINGRNYLTGELVMVGLVEAFIDRLAQVLESTGDDIDTVSREVFRNRVDNAPGKSHNLQSLIERIGSRGDMLSLARESLVSIVRLTSFHQALEGPNTKAAREMRQELKVLQRDAAALTDHASFLSNKINFLLDATLGLINLEQNQIIKIFSVAAVVFLPPTLVASIYGMNYDAMPELHWEFGYPFALGLMILSAVLPYLFFKRKRWL